MRYKLYTLVDITHTEQIQYNKKLQWKEQNFNTVLQTIGLRSNFTYFQSPTLIEVKGNLIGFNTDDIIRVWRFDFITEQNDCYQKHNDPVGLLKEDFNLVPYIKGLDEMMVQNYAVFVTNDPGKNIVFFHSHF